MESHTEDYERIRKILSNPNISQKDKIILLKMHNIRMAIKNDSRDVIIKRQRKGILKLIYYIYEKIKNYK
jgi:hypothetical protein